MKKLIVLSNLALMLLSSCAGLKNSTYTDDVYANPKVEKQEEARLAAIAKEQREAREKAYKDSVAADQKAKDDANPYYKDRDFKYDDYYDYEYATRLRRFDNSVYGLGYYDNYYTNSYWYSGNPYNYGVSVYNGYSWWGPGYNSYSYYPSVNFYNNWGWGCSPVYGYGGYNPYYNPYGSAYWQGYYNGYNQGYMNGWYGYPYYGYGNPYYGYGGWNNPYYGWGYFNILDNNSGYTYGFRSSSTGGNNRRITNAGMNADDSYYNRYMTNAVQQQGSVVKFSEIKPRSNKNNSVRDNGNDSNGGTLSNGNSGNGTTGGIKDVNPNGNNGNATTTPIRNTPRKNTEIKNSDQGGGYNPGVDLGNTPGSNNPTTPVKNNPIRNTPIKTNDVPVKGNNNNTSPSFDFPSNQNNNTPIRNGGGGEATPKSNGGGHRPR